MMKETSRGGHRELIKVKPAIAKVVLFVAAVTRPPLKEVFVLKNTAFSGGHVSNNLKI